MKRQISLTTATLALILVSSAVNATPATDALFAKYGVAGATTFSADTGKSLWVKEVEGKEGIHSCSTCHGQDVKAEGKHAKTEKPIKPMAASANDKRFTDEKKVEKWFKRNCKWTWGRECTAQEKGDILTYLLSQ